MPRLVDRGLRWLVEQRWLLVIFVAAVAVRWHWNAVVHPPGDYIYSDMTGYVARAARLLHRGLEPHEYSSFFPYGTHWLVAGVQWVWGEDNWVAVGRVYAVLGGVAVASAYAVARRASAFPSVVAPIVGVIGIIYYPTLSLGGYILSETPYTALFCLALVFLMRTIDTGRLTDALAMGVCVGLAVVFRPQIMLSAAMIGLFWILRRKAVPRLRLTHLLVCFVPVLVMLALSSALLRHNTGRSGLVSENGPLNLVFGRCHNEKIESFPDGKGHGHLHFRPPPFIQLNAREAKRRQRGQPVGIAMHPAMGKTLSYRGYIGDRDKHMGMVRACLDKTTWGQQLEYSATNVLLLWHYNVPWPDSSVAGVRPIARWWTQRHAELLAIPALLGLGFMVSRRTAKLGFIAANLLAMLVLAAVYFGAARHRSTYDYVILILAIEVYAWFFRGLYQAITKLRARRRPADPVRER